MILPGALIGCSPFHESNAASPDAASSDGALPDGASPDGASPDGASLDGAGLDTGILPDGGSLIQCGAVRCPAAPDSVCCVTASGSSCTTASACTGVKIACDDTADCAALGADYICCAYDDAVMPTPSLLRSVCAVSANCDARGARDQMCDLGGSTNQCQVAADGRTACTVFPYSNASGYSVCMYP